MFEGIDMSRRFGKGRRASTLRKHTKTWMKARSWMRSTFLKPWPESAEEFALYLECRAGEPCGKSVPGSIYRTLLFMESAGEFPVDQQVGKSAAIKNTLEEHAAGISSIEVHEEGMAFASHGGVGFGEEGPGLPRAIPGFMPGLGW